MRTTAQRPSGGHGARADGGAVRRALVALTTGLVVQRVALFVATVLLVRWLGLERLGAYAAATQVTTLVLLLVDGGTRLATNRALATVAGDPPRTAALLARSLAGRFRLALGATAPAVLLPLGLPALGVPVADPGLWLVCALAIPLGVLDLKGIADAMGAVRDEVLFESIGAWTFALAVVAVCAAAAASGTGVEPVAIAACMVAGRLVYAWFAWRWYRDRLGASTADERRAASAHVDRLLGAPRGLRAWIGVGQIVQRIVHAADVVLVRVLAGEAAAGVFFAAARILVAAQVPLQVLTRLAQPHLNHAAVRGDVRATLERVLRANAYVTVPIALTIPIVAEGLMVGLYGADFAGGAGTLAVLALGSFVYSTGGRLQNAQFAVGQHGPWLIASLCGSAAVVACAIPTVPALGALGMALAGVAGRGAGLVWSSWTLSRVVVVPWRPALARPMALGSIAAAVGVVASPAGALTAAGLSACAGVVAFAALELRGGFASVGDGLGRSSGFGDDLRATPQDQAATPVVPADAGRDEEDPEGRSPAQRLAAER